MSEKHQKKKQPEQVRANLLEATAQRIIKDGFQGLRVETVAKDAGVSKGGLFHHFANKAALLEGLYEEQYQQFEQELEDLMADDPISHGRFTRAYLRVCSNEINLDESKVFFALVLGDSEFKARMVEWMQERLERHAATENFPESAVVIHATDGLWMSTMIDEKNAMTEFREKTRQTLLQMTYPKE